MQLPILFASRLREILGVVFRANDDFN